jgi:hypothetical protein
MVNARVAIIIASIAGALCASASKTAAFAQGRPYNVDDRYPFCTALSRGRPYVVIDSSRLVLICGIAIRGGISEVRAVPVVSRRGDTLFVSAAFFIPNATDVVYELPADMPVAYYVYYGPLDRGARLRVTNVTHSPYGRDTPRLDTLIRVP